MKKRKSYVRMVSGLFLAAAVLWLIPRPSNERNWVPNQAVLPFAEFDGDVATVRNIRNSSYRSTEDYTPEYYDRSFDLRRLVGAWYVVEPFSEWKGAAHTFLSFEFEGPEFLSISAEIRKEEGESFSALKGLFKQYEIMYVIADERDAIGLRTNHRKDDVFLYPVRASTENLRDLFLSMLERANHLQDSPEFYNSLTNTCTTNIVRHINDLVPGRIPLSYKVLFPGYSDELAYDLGLLDTDLPFEAARNRFKIDDQPMEALESPDFPLRIRDFGR